MDDFNKNILKNWVYLVHNLCDIPNVLLHLVQEDIISMNESHTTKEKTGLDRNEELLCVLMKKDLDVKWQTVKKIFQSTGNSHIAQKIERAVNQSVLQNKTVEGPEIFVANTSDTTKSNDELAKVANNSKTVKNSQNYQPNSNVQDSKDIQLNHFKNFEVIDSGAFGVVMKAKHRESKLIYAIKITHEDSYRELDSLRKSSHANIVSFINSWSERANEQTSELHDNFQDYRQMFCIQMEYCKGRNLNSWILKPPSQKSEWDAKRICFQISLGVESLHSKNIIHRDLKPANILLLNTYKKDQDDLVVKIGDLGLSRTTYQISKKTKRSLMTNCGTELYMSPEQEMKLDRYDHKADIFPMGIIFYAILNSTISEHAQMESIREGILPSDFIHKFETEAGLIKNMLAKNPALRPTASEIVSLFNAWWIIDIHLLSEKVVNLEQVLLSLLQDNIISKQESHDVKSGGSIHDQKLRLLKLIKKKNLSPTSRNRFWEIMQKSNNENCATQMETAGERPSGTKARSIDITQTAAKEKSVETNTDEVEEFVKQKAHDYYNKIEGHDLETLVSNAQKEITISKENPKLSFGENTKFPDWEVYKYDYQNVDDETLMTLFKEKKFNESSKLAKLIHEELKTKTTKYNYAICLKSSGHIGDCVKLLGELYSEEKGKLKKQKQEESIGYALMNIWNPLFKYLKQNKLREVVEDQKLFDLAREPSVFEIINAKLICYFQLEKYDKAFSFGKCAIVNVSQVIQILQSTAIPNYYLKCEWDNMTLQFDGQTKNIELTKCSLDLSFVQQLSPIELTLSKIYFVLNGRDLKEVTINKFLDLQKISRLKLGCEKLKNNISIDLSGEIFMESLHLENVRVMNWKESNWTAKKLILWEVPFVEKTKMKIEEMESKNSSVDISCLPQTIQKVTLFETGVICTGEIELPKFRYLTLRSMSDTSCLSHFHTINLTHIYFNNMVHINVDLLPERVKQIKVTNGHKLTVSGGVKKFDKVIFEHYNLDQARKHLNHFRTENIVVDNGYWENYYNSTDVNELMKDNLNSKIAIGPIDYWDLERITKVVDRDSKFYLIQGERATGIGWEEFSELAVLF